MSENNSLRRRFWQMFPPLSLNVFPQSESSLTHVCTWFSLSGLHPNFHCYHIDITKKNSFFTSYPAQLRPVYEENSFLIKMFKKEKKTDSAIYHQREPKLTHHLQDFFRRKECDSEWAVRKSLLFTTLVSDPDSLTFDPHHLAWLIP